mmetsp:Transcript_7759/g.15979  ORF Transcript_7759/g.15979 Transcript_7759/m.15979 type:complete len:343 (-) Transcript_7759:830-1858(-)
MIKKRLLLFLDCCPLLASEGVLRHPFGQKLKGVAVVVVELAVSSFDARVLEDLLEFILFPHHAGVDRAPDELAVDEKLGKGLAPGFFLQGRPVLVPHVVLGEFEGIDVDAVVLYAQGIEEAGQRPTKLAVLEHETEDLAAADLLLDPLSRLRLDVREAGRGRWHRRGRGRELFFLLRHVGGDPLEEGSREIPLTGIGDQGQECGALRGLLRELQGRRQNPAPARSRADAFPAGEFLAGFHRLDAAAVEDAVVHPCLRGLVHELGDEIGGPSLEQMGTPDRMGDLERRGRTSIFGVGGGNPGIQHRCIIRFANVDLSLRRVFFQIAPNSQDGSSRSIRTHKVV